MKHKKALKEEYAPAAWKELQKGNYGDADLARIFENPYDPVDIIAVQGLASTYEWTWTKETPAGEVMWLRHLLPVDLPNARILTFEYGSKWYKDPDHVSLRDCGKKLLKRIMQDRSHHQGDMCQTMNKRPIIFIGHSYGGLVIKQALVLASNLKPHEKHYLDYRSILTSITGILYLGTPHCGSSFARYGKMQTKLRAWAGKPTNTEILAPLELNSKKSDLFDLQEDFERLIEMKCLSDLRILHFFETKSVQIGVGFLGMQIGIVVTKESACMGARADSSFTLEANHMELNKFGSREEENYQAVLQPLKEIWKVSAGIVASRWAGSQLHYDYDSPNSNTELKDLQNWLAPNNMFMLRLQRLSDVVEASPGTCEWATNNEAVARWMDPSQTLELRYRSLWIHGKPGSGKSVISAYLWGVIRDRTPTAGLNKLGSYVCPGICSAETCAEPPVDVPGLAYVSLENQQDVTSALGYIIHQLIRQRKRDTEVLRAALKFMANTEVLSQFSAVKLLKKIAARLPTTFIIIDGIDECDSAEELLHLIRPLTTDTSNIRLLLLSRASPEIRKLISERFCEPANMVDIALENTSDINHFIETQISQLILRRPQLEGIQDVIVQRMKEYARGMFQWVKLKMHGLEMHGDNEQNALEILGAFPQSLNEVYKKSFDRYYDEEYPEFKRKRASLALKWIVCAARPLHPRELRMALELEELWSQDDVVARNSATEIFAYCSSVVAGISDLDIETELHELLDPFIELQTTVTNNITWKAVHICHLSVSQLLLGNDPTFKNAGYAEFAFSTHDVNSFAAMTCLRMISSLSNFYSFIDLSYGKFITREFPTTEKVTEYTLLQYAYENWAVHLNACDIPFSAPDDLFTLATHALSAGMQASLDTIGGLADLFGTLNIQTQGNMYIMVALRDAQNALLPAATSMETLLPDVPALAERLKKINTTVKARQIRSGGSFRRRTTGFTESGNLVKGVKMGRLNTNGKGSSVLDSVLAAEAFELTKTYKEMYRPIRKAMAHLQRTSRDLRRLSFALGVDPVRNWLDQPDVVGEGGKNPIAILAHTSYLADIYSMLPVLPRLRPSTLRLEDQFKADGSHPLFGPMSAVLAELDQGNSTLPAGFYEEHIEPHLLLEKGEWESIRLGLYLFETSPNQVNQHANHEALRMLLYNVLKFPIIESVDTYGTILPSTIFEQLKPRFLRRRGRSSWFAKIQEWPRYVLPTVAKVIMLICPPVEALFFSMLRELMARMQFTSIIVKNFVREWRYSLVGSALYLARWRFFPRFFRYNTRLSIVADFWKVVHDPLTPVPMPSLGGFWKVMGVYLVRTAVFSTYFGMKAAIEQMRENPSVSYGTVPEPAKTPLRIIEKFLDLIYFEYGFAAFLEAIIELFGVAAVLAKPNIWTWGSITGSIQSVLITIMIKELGFLQTIIIVARYTLTLLAWSRLQRSVWVREMVGRYALPALSATTAFLARHAIFAPVLRAATSLRSLYAKIGPATLVKVIAGITVVYYGTLTYILLDPLRLRRSERARKKARRAVVKARKGKEDWNERLGWVALKPVNPMGLLGLQLYQAMLGLRTDVGV